MNSNTADHVVDAAKRIALAAAAACVAVTACGGDAPDDSAAAAKSLIVSELTGPEYPFSENEADCIANYLVDTNGMTVEEVRDELDPSTASTSTEDLALGREAVAACVDGIDPD